MKRIIRLFVILLAISFLAGITTSCAIFEDSHVQKQQSFKHTKPLPKKYVVDNGRTSILK